MSKDLLDAIESHKVTKDFWSFYYEANSESVLTEKEELLVRLAASVASSCVPWMKKYLGVAEENDVLTKDEIFAALGITMTVSAGKNLMHFLQSMQPDNEEKHQAEDKNGCSPGCCD